MQPADIRKNFFFNVMDGALFALGMGLASRTAVLPIFVKRLGGDNIAIGLIPVLWVLGFNLPQILVANYVQSRDQKKPIVLITAILQRLPWLLLAVLTFTVFQWASTTQALFLFFLALALAAIGGSVNLPAWFDLIAKVTPVRLRGRLFGLRTVSGSALGLLAGWLIEQILDSMGFHEGFALLFGLAFAVMMISYVFLTLLVETGPVEAGRRRSYRAFVTRLPGLLREHRNFRNFVIAEAMLVMATTAEAFFAVDAFARFELTAGFAGRFTAVAAGSVMVSSLLFGYLADRFGHKLTLLLSASLLTLSCLGAILAPTVEVYYLVFVGSAFTLSLRNISQFAIIAELCRESERPTFVALKNAVTAPFVLAGLLGGWIANIFGYNVLFVAAAAIAFSSALWLATMVEEPRSERANRYES